MNKYKLAKWFSMISINLAGIFFLSSMSTLCLGVIFGGDFEPYRKAAALFMIGCMWSFIQCCVIYFIVIEKRGNNSLEEFNKNRRK